MEQIEKIAESIAASPGQVVAVEVGDRDRVADLVARLQPIYDYGYDADDGADVRLALGSACSTLERALEHFAAAMQLPYGAARTLWEFFEAVSQRPSAYRSCLVVADAAELLADEDELIWRALADELVDGPRCMGGGWNTLVLVDDHTGWASSRFGSAADAELAAKARLSSDEYAALQRGLELRYRAD
ncbi:hypothetical protein [Nocardia cerradoensis]|uniref:hypothetical protein n=1 Tax=Nocardia cerradoensis TaxID=85688 RepID=UPI0002F7A33C|nr:hypothetical protein [Nocardia cerradoensis]NKY45792.1 hypothetical protein [Nocardia cerradoensis]